MSAYFENVVMSVVVDGKPQREFRGDDGIRTVRLPFNTEYKLRFKNSRWERVGLEISIDGYAATKLLVVNPKQTVDLERFLEIGNKFLFVEKGQTQDPNNPGLGGIRVRIFRENHTPTWTLTTSYPSIYTTHFNSNSFGSAGGAIDGFVYGNAQNIPGGSDLLGAANTSAHYMSVDMGSVTMANTNATPTGVVTNNSDVGGTVEGSRSNQQLTDTNGYFNELIGSIVVNLKGPFVEPKVETVVAAKSVVIKFQNGQYEVSLNGKKLHTTSLTIGNDGVAVIKGPGNLEITTSDYEIK